MSLFVVVDSDCFVSLAGFTTSGGVAYIVDAIC